MQKCTSPSFACIEIPSFNGRIPTSLGLAIKKHDLNLTSALCTELTTSSIGSTWAANSSFQKILLQMYVRPIIQHSPDFTRYMVQSCTKNCIKMDIIIHLLVFLNFYSHVQNLSRHFLELKEAEISVSFQLASITLLYCCNNTQNTTILMKNPNSTPQVLIYLSNYEIIYSVILCDYMQ